MCNSLISISAMRLVFATSAAFLCAARVDAAICVDVDPHVTVSRVSHSLIATLEREATAIWAPYAVDLRWTPDSCAIEDASFELQIDRDAPSTLRHVSVPVLGTTLVRQTRVERVPIRVYYDAMQ